MLLAEVQRILQAHHSELADHAVRTVSVFGSVARGEARPGSDVDLLVEFNRPVGYFALARLQIRLEELLGTRVDLVTPDALRGSMRDEVLREAVRAA